MKIIKTFVFCLFLFIATGLIIQCTSKSSKNSVDATNIKVPSGYVMPLVVRLTGVGNNYQPQFSPDGHFLTYVSSDRPSHDNPQVYVMQVDGKKEKRISFQDGKTAHPTFSPDGRRVIYGSTTDEAKEDAHFIKDSLEKITGQQGTNSDNSSFWQDQPYELYSSLVKGSRIERLTQSSKYDSEASIEPNDKRMIFISARDGHLNIHLASTTGTYVKAITKSKSVKASPVYSPDGQSVAWVEFDDNLMSSQIHVGDALGKEAKAITSGNAIHFQPSWSSDNSTLLFSSNRDEAGNYEIYAIQKSGECLQRLTYHSAQDTEPSVSPEQKQYLFTSDRSGEKQIYLSDYTLSKTCTTP